MTLIKIAAFILLPEIITTETVTFDSLRQSSDLHIEPAGPDGRYKVFPQITL